MRIGKAVATLAFIGANACIAVAASSSEPEWLKAKIAQFEQLPVGNPARAILRTTYAGRTVYYVTATCCDIPSELYEQSGELICFPDGGFAGGDGRCPRFTLPSSAVTVWRDVRPVRSRPGVPESPH